MAEFRLETERLILRDWCEEDIDELQRMDTDPAVMATLGPLRDREATREVLDYLMARADKDGHTFWALERKSDGRMIGSCGVARVMTILQIEGELEIGWRLASDCWGRSYAREAAEATLAWIAANRPGEPVFAMTSASNARSRVLTGAARHALLRRHGLRPSEGGGGIAAHAPCPLPQG